MGQFPEIAEFARENGYFFSGTHVVLTSRNHSTDYGNFRFLQETKYSDALTFYTMQLMQETAQNMGIDVEDVVWMGPETMGEIMVRVMQAQ